MTNSRNMISIVPIMILTFIGLCLLFSLLNAGELAEMDAAIANPQVKPIDTHSTNHAESAAVVDCGNILSVWLDSRCEKLNIIKQLEDGRYCDEVVLPSRRGLLLKTAYALVGAASEKDVEDILKAKGCTKIAP